VPVNSKIAKMVSGITRMQQSCVISHHYCRYTLHAVNFTCFYILW